jgi:Na+(H+)/acetate symporter ActP
MLSRLVIAVVYGVITTLVCVLVGGLLGSFGVSWAATIGAFLVHYSGLLGLLVALLTFFGNPTAPTWFKRG